MFLVGRKRLNTSLQSPDAIPGGILVASPRGRLIDGVRAVGLDELAASIAVEAMGCRCQCRCVGVVLLERPLLPLKQV